MVFSQVRFFKEKFDMYNSSHIAIFVHGEPIPRKEHSR